jgi:putative spermidine/putrescine transport system ATP-binding protein
MSAGRLEQLATPSEVYSNPSSAFVARFVGSMNELPATIRGRDTVEVAGLAIASPSAATRNDGERVTWLVRPEDLRVAGAGEPGLAATVTATTFEGASTIVGLRVDVLDVLVKADISSSTASHLSPGDRVSVQIDGARAVCETIGETNVVDEEPAA